MNIAPIATAASRRDDYTYSGTVSFYNADRGFGFITADDRKFTQPLWVHYTNIQGPGNQALEVGQRVGFNAYQGAKGPAATAVRVLQESMRAAA